jgi:hypothetical protein
MRVKTLKERKFDLLPPAMEKLNVLGKLILKLVKIGIF